ncbi:MAG TPA: carboxypeptidase regulatory-like domain-containing protein [Pirellulales bacterium]|nr:carboxypeptidase regulatory-like domain-containing protein [Pirellulales bacterium]
MMRSVRWLAFGSLAAAFAGLWLRPSAPPAVQQTLVGRVLSDSQPVPSARVRYQGQATFVLTDKQGRFTLARYPPGDRRVTVSASGCFIGGASAESRPLVIELSRLPNDDCQTYAWVRAEPNPESPGNCGNCHREIYDEWRGSGHASSNHNRRFQNLFEGSDWQGTPGRGWSLLDEYPAGAGVCAACHAPTAKIDDVALPSGPGVDCDFCHKIRETRVEHAGLTHGRYAYDLLRPAEGQIFFGPLDDVDRGEDIYSPLQSESRYCAGCHEGVVFGVHVYSTWSEWLASPARRQGRQCQTCHMTPSGKLTNLAAGNGGIEREASTLASHTFLPGGREAMLRSAVRLAVRVDRAAQRLAVEVRLMAENVGHRLPTGFIDRHLVLAVEPLTAAGVAVDVVSGPKLPAAAGAELAGRPGRLFAKLLSDAEGRTAPFWRAGLTLDDTRLAPGKPETYRFVLPDDAASIRVRLFYRRFWPEAARSKNWPSDEIVIVDETHSLGSDGAVTAEGRD